MSLTIFEKVKDFLVRLVKDEAFYTQLMTDKIEEVIKVMEEGGYNFSQEEFETASIKILELKELGQFDDLSEEELVGAFGGFISINQPVIEPPLIIQPKLRDVVVSLPENFGKPSIKPIKWIPRPLPKPWPLPCQIDPPVQALYGAVVSSTEVQ
ncbi:Nif11-like leader peptide family RiPP precursor [Nostoc sp. 'Peltigera malacea cyanobiont' DB3992]|uniref:Nif11-like leader peptide family RiPP precursor n=1 Tax=Nostoc sp. 'Peltigera malacea cyanobiont' DB3992 TaxID=1206980 RepID=UPI000C04E96A|nr:Nif11-like leader peptide family RiPP precursor [Nostoc sp. 'Peltigera malacea cyanobiont' DB3992]PHM10621.1 Nif11-like leader peptide family natural product precursor [Nostoc sp. 'Peltigera malacea cyanobiont' DB3992]